MIPRAEAVDLPTVYVRYCRLRVENCEGKEKVGS